MVGLSPGSPVVFPGPRKELPARIFALALGHAGGELQIGGHDPAAVRPGSHITYLPVVNTLRSVGYQLQVAGLRVGSTELLDEDEISRLPPALADSGTSCIMLPRQPMNAILTQFQCRATRVDTVQHRLMRVDAV